jgi:hypothetical protein
MRKLMVKLGGGNSEAVPPPFYYIFAVICGFYSHNA